MKFTTNDRLCLVGMPAAGKSFLAEAFALFHNITWFDSDRCLEHAQQKTIDVIFEHVVKDGDDSVFRELEYNVIADIVKYTGPWIMATGGGSFVHPPTRKLLLQHCRVIWLNTPSQWLLPRLKASPRPVFKKFIEPKDVEKMLNDRLPYYQQAHHHLTWLPEWYQNPDLAIHTLTLIITKSQQD